MKLDDLKEMRIPYLTRIEVEYDQECIPPQVGRYLGYFRSIDGNTLTHYGSPDAPSQIPERHGWTLIGHIRSVTVLVPK